MSPVFKTSTSRVESVPRASGDEPFITLLTITQAECSPRERG